MSADLIVNSFVSNQSVVNVIWRHAWIEWKYGIWVFTRVLKKVLRFHRLFCQRWITFIQFINQYGTWFSKRFRHVVRDLERRTSQRVYRHSVAFVEPKPDRGIELTLNRILARDCGHFSAMSAMASLLAAVSPFRFAFQNLRARNGHYFCCESLETLEWRFFFLWLGMLHGVQTITLRTPSQRVHNGSSDSNDYQIQEQNIMPREWFSRRRIKDEVMGDPNPCVCVAVSQVKRKDPRRK